MPKAMKPMEEWVEKDYSVYISRRKHQILEEKEKIQKSKDRILKFTKELREFQDAYAIYRANHPKVRKNAAKKNDYEFDPVGRGGTHHADISTPESDAKLAAELCYPINIRHALLSEPDFAKRQKILRDARLRYH